MLQFLNSATLASKQLLTVYKGMDMLYSNKLLYPKHVEVWIRHTGYSFQSLKQSNML